jgi:tetratricopeptide (TPR) repeat protein
MANISSITRKGVPKLVVFDRAFFAPLKSPPHRDKIQSMIPEQPLCFVLMPFGTKRDPVTTLEINFDAVYDQAIRPAIEAASMVAVRADEERTGGIIHKPMFERLLLCDFAVADLTTGNPNVYYELGVRHAARPSTTLAIFAHQQRLPFDLNFLRALPYRLGEGNRFGAREASELTSNLMRRLMDLTEIAHDQGGVDSPLFQLLSEYKAPDIAHLKTDLFRERVQYSAGLKSDLARARELGDLEAVEAIESKLGDLDSVEMGVLVDLYLTWRALSQWDRMIRLYERLPYALKRTTLVREQLGFALNRAGRREEALRALEGVLQEQGPSSETLGLIGRIYKDQWMEARKRGSERLAQGYLAKSIEFYTRGFEADSRDAYPGINAVTMLDIQGDPKSLKYKSQLLPVVRFAVVQRLKGAKPIYWDYATLLELAVLEESQEEAFLYLSSTLANVREPWEAATTANNLKFIQEARRSRDLEQPWLGEIIAELESRSAVAARR